jgi:ribosomal protein S18 acetylase RimI-like enzyme
MPVYDEPVPIEIRPYRPSDLRRLHAIDQAAFDPSLAWSLEELRGFVSWRRAHTLVAESEGVIVAFASGLITRTGIGHVTTLDVLPAAQRQGLGSRLLAVLESWLWAQGVRLILLETVVGPAGARAFYEKHGYVVLERLPRHYGNGRDGYLMAKKGAPALAPGREDAG